MDKNLIAKIIEKNDIVDVISEYITLERGNKCLCPFHDDNNASCSISKEKQFFKCFACGEKGNVVSFMMKYHHVNFLEAVKMLADRVNIDVDIKTVQENPNNHLFELNKTIQEYANFNLLTNQNAMKYLEKRKISKEMIEKFNLGFIKNSSELETFLIAKGYTNHDFNQIKLFNPTGYCYLEQRLIFPIENQLGTVGFQARSIEENPKIKYMNTSENEIFNKGSVFYGLKQAIDVINKKNSVYFVEGNIDAIKISQLGIENVVAVQGSQLAEKQLKLLQKMNVKVFLAMDNDNAGFNATKKIYEQLTSKNIDVKIVCYQGKDPDESIKQNQVDFINAMENPVEIYQLFLNKNIDMNDYVAKQQLIEQYFEVLKLENNQIKIFHYLQLLSNKLEIPFELVKNQFNQNIDINTVVDNTNTISDHSIETSQYSKKSVLINLKQKSKVDYRNEVKNNYDSQFDVLCFDETKLFKKRSELLYKYMQMKGTMLETTITFINFDYTEERLRTICDKVHEELAKNFNQDKSQYHYVAFMHHHSKHPHLHMQLFQKETYFKNYLFSNQLVQNIQNTLEEMVRQQTINKNIGSPQGTTFKL